MHKCASLSVDGSILAQRPEKCGKRLGNVFPIFAHKPKILCYTGHAKGKFDITSWIKIDMAEISVREVALP